MRWYRLDAWDPLVVERGSWGEEPDCPEQPGVLVMANSHLDVLHVSSAGAEGLLCHFESVWPQRPEGVELALWLSTDSPSRARELGRRLALKYAL